MIYIPILKNRKSEMQAISEIHKCLSDKIIPLFEIIDEKYQDRFEVDPVTNECIMEIKPGNRRKTKKKLPSTEADIVTLSKINKAINGEKAFIDYFRFSADEYKTVNIDLQKVELALKCRSWEFYKAKLLKVDEFKNFIPVISIKNIFLPSLNEMKDLVTLLKVNNISIAIRCELKFVDKYISIFKLLREEDFILVDIRENSFDSQEIGLEDIDDVETVAKLVLLNSPRKVGIKNTQYEEYDFTNLIDNSALIKCKSYFKGIGDFGGLKDTLPEIQAGSNGMGSAISLLFFYQRNKFWSTRNIDTKQGMRGYQEVKKEILANSKFFDPDNDCLAMKAINKLNNGTYSSWNYITLLRYIHQMFKYI